MLPFTDPLVLAGAVIVFGFFGSRSWQRRSYPAYYLMRVLVFASLTVLLLKGGTVPYRPRPASGSELSQLYVTMLEITWWLGAAWVAVGFFRAFMVWGKGPRESKLLQDLLAGMIYLLAVVGIIGDVFDLPVQGLLATSGAAAIVIGLALQSSLGDVFSGVVLNLERPYRVGDWIIVDDVIQGEVVETNWRSTHVLRSSLDIAIIPNSVIAKAKIVNCSSPSPYHRITLRTRLEPSVSPNAASRLLHEVLLSSRQIMQQPPPVVAVRDLSAEALELEISATVESYPKRDVAQNEVYERLYRAVAAAGWRFSPRLPGTLAPFRHESASLDLPERLLAGVPLFATLTAEERAVLAGRMERKAFKSGEQVKVTSTLCIVSEGVVAAYALVDGESLEVGRLAAGDYFGEHDLLTGERRVGLLIALTPVTVFEVSKADFAPLLTSHPHLESELSQRFSFRQFETRASEPPMPDAHTPEPGMSNRFAKAIRKFLSPGQRP